MAFDAEMMKVQSLTTQEMVKRQYEEYVMGVKEKLYSIAPVLPAYTLPQVDENGVCDCPSCKAAREPVSVGWFTDTKKQVGYLKVARERIAQGWTQGATFRGNAACAMGAILYALNGQRDDDTTMDQSMQNRMDTMAKLLPGMSGTRDVIRYNDMPGTTKADVLHLFDAAIARLENLPLPAPVKTPRPFTSFAYNSI